MPDINANDTSYGDAYLRVMRGLRRAGQEAPFHRAPLNGEEADRMAIVNRIIGRDYSFGYRSSAGDPAGVTDRSIACERCGRTFSDARAARLARTVYAKHGRMDFYRCRGGCEGSASADGDGEGNAS